MNYIHTKMVERGNGRERERETKNKGHRESFLFDT